MNKNIKQVIVILVSLIIAYIVFKILKAAIYAIIIGAVLFIGYNLANKLINGKKKDELE